MYKLLCVFLVLFSANCLYAQNKDYRAQFISESIVLDGKPDEKSWETAPAVYFVANNKGAICDTSYFKALWDSEYLYFYINLKDDDIQCTMYKRDDHLWHEEVLEIFVDADCNPKTYYEFQWNALNTVLDLFILNPNCSREKITQWWDWNSAGLKSSVFVDGTISNSSDIDNFWGLEIAIPFSSIENAPNIPPQNGDIWKIDLTRREGTEANNDLQKSSWLPPSTHFPLSYGNLVFVKK
jgi:hypothetical protein